MLNVFGMVLKDPSLTDKLPKSQNCAITWKICKWDDAQIPNSKLQITF